MKCICNENDKILYINKYRYEIQTPLWNDLDNAFDISNWEDVLEPNYLPWLRTKLLPTLRLDRNAEKRGRVKNYFQ